MAGEARSGRRACELTRSPNPIKTFRVEARGTREKRMFLPKEVWQARACQKSAEAIVVMRAVERRQERRAEGTTAKRPGGL